ncbi:MAG: TonB family protein [Candidatus Binatia bacterium]
MNPENDSFLITSLIASCLIHAVAVLLTPVLITNNRTPASQDLVPIGLVDLQRAKPETPLREEEKPVASTKPSSPPPPKPKVEKRERPQPIEKPKPVIKKAPVEEPALPPRTSPLKDEPAKPSEPHTTTLPARPAPLSPTAPVEGGGNEAGAGNLFGKGDVGMVPGAGTSGGGGGTAVSGLGRGSGAPGLPVPTTPLRTNREATPLQTVRASYPPMALRMGLEGDVTLRIEVDTKGKVTRTEIVKSGGAGFDEEALKAVKQARFEPAHKDGKKVPAEFTYIYRFRLKK